MERTTWGQINELFEAARRLPADEREAWVRAATTDERVQSEVLSLLEAHEDDPWFVEETGGRRTPVRVTPAGTWLGKRTPIPPGSTPAQVAPGRAASTPSGLPRPRHAPEPKAGGQFATYRLVREMFRDPARIVFEAVAAAGSAHPRVALHVLAADAHEPAFAALLHAQGGILAHLDHPGIPRLIDGGVTGDGTAYLAFEYVAGAPIDAWCRERGLTVADRVGRVLAVCEAVQHAHEHLVAHSDLRPSNVLVPADATVRLLDCGMSRFLEFDLSPGGPGAPVHQYMSPEQARGEVLTTASDVYGLGILLYTLATGYPPYDLGGQTPPRARRTICDSEVEVPSAVADGRDQRRLAGTLDRIILKALRKNPRERYATAAALAADLRAWRDGRPASVVPATRWSRAMTGGWRAVRAGAVAIAVLAPLAGAGLLGWQAYVFRGERDRARAGLAEAERQARAAEERAAEERAAEERAAPRPVAELRLELAAAANDMALAERRGGNLPGAEALWAQSLADVRPVLDADPGNLRALAHVAAVRTSLGSLVRSQRRFEESLVQYREALRARERATAADDTPEAALALADARTSVARLLLDLVEVRRPGPNDAARPREASALLAQAGPVVRTAAASPAQQDALAELDRQSARLSRLTSRRR